jgi:hypothetical protein
MVNERLTTTSLGVCELYFTAIQKQLLISPSVFARAAGYTCARMERSEMQRKIEGVVVIDEPLE